MDEMHKGFLRRLARSHEGVWHVARWIWDMKDNDVVITARREAPDREHYKDFVDSGDLYVNGDRHEVKWLTSSFTGIDDWPAQWNRKFIVCRKQSFDQGLPVPKSIIVLSADKKAVGVVNVKETREKWYVKETTALQHEYYYCPIERVVFRSTARKKAEWEE